MLYKECQIEDSVSWLKLSLKWHCKRTTYIMGAYSYGSIQYRIDAVGFMVLLWHLLYFMVLQERRRHDLVISLCDTNYTKLYI